MTHRQEDYCGRCRCEIEYQLVVEAVGTGALVCCGCLTEPECLLLDLGVGMYGPAGRGFRFGVKVDGEPGVTYTLFAAWESQHITLNELAMGVLIGSLERAS